MAIIQAIFLGIIEGLTEFLPISSTGHLVIAEQVIGYKDAAELFTVVVQLGAIAAVLWHYRQDLADKTRGLFTKDKAAIKFWTIWVLATIPAAVAGLLFSNTFERLATVEAVAVTLLLGGLLIWFIETNHKTKTGKSKPQFESLSFGQAIKVGLFQVLALVPGVSRSGATIMGGILCGLDRVTATAFSFYLSIPILVLAGGYKLVKDGDQISAVTGGAAALVVGTIAAFLSALLVIKWLLKYVAHHDFKIFAYYRIILGLVIILSLTLS